MKTEEQVCTIKQAIRLKELGIKQDSLFYWIDRGVNSRLVYSGQIEFLDMLPIVSAFTVAELLSLTPWRVDNDYRFQLRHFDSGRGIRTYQVLYKDLDGGLLYDLFNDTAAQVLADNIIHLLENKLI